MKKSKHIFLFICLLFHCVITWGHTPKDSIVLPYTTYLNDLLLHHPISRKSDLKLDLADVERLGARGNFDPDIQANWNQKNFDDKLYYQNYSAKITVPTPIGIDVVGGYENTSGSFVNPENNTGSFGLWNLGVEADIWQGLLVNERRMAIQRAEVFGRLAQNQQLVILNDLVFDATMAYILWQQYIEYSKVYNENVDLASEYFQFTKESFLGGEKTAMDTLEAYIAYQDAILLVQKNQIGLIKSIQTVENFLWNENTPVALTPQVLPQPQGETILNIKKTWAQSDLQSHPELQSKVNQLSILEIEQKLKREKLKPKVKLKFNPLIATRGSSPLPVYSINDIKWGVNFSMPILRMSERADIQRGNIKISEKELELSNKRNELVNKSESKWLQYWALKQQVGNTAANIDSYNSLLLGEKTKFEYGESSVFMVNKRQEKYISTRIKLIQIQTLRQITLLEYLYFTNQLLD